MNGWIYASSPRWTVGIIVRDLVVVDAPPIARRWVLGRPARDVWRELSRRGATSRLWYPEATS